MAKIPPAKIKVLTPGTLDPKDVLQGTCNICGSKVETTRENTLQMRAPKSQDSVLCLGVECQTEGCSNWIVMQKPEQ